MMQNGTDTPDVSVVIPAYGVAAYIVEAIDSVLVQASKSAVEVIVVNDGSPDTQALEKVLEPYRDRIVYVKQENGGVSSARNAGIRAAHGEWLAFLDGDDAWLPHYLDAQFAALGAESHADMVFGNAILFGDTQLAGECIVPFSQRGGEITFLKAVSGECTISYCAVVRREMVIRAGLFDTGLRGSEDFNLWLRVLKTGGRIMYHRKPIYRYRRREGSATSDPVWMNERILESLLRAEETIPMSSEEHLGLERHRQKIEAGLAVARGKAAFCKRDSKSAAAHYREAYKLTKNRKIQAILLLLRFCPHLTYAAYDLRQKRLVRAARG